MPTKLSEDRLGELLLRWDELRRQGRDLPAGELCADIGRGLDMGPLRVIDVLIGRAEIADAGQLASDDLGPTEKDRQPTGAGPGS